jgi:hypothetical protein
MIGLDFLQASRIGFPRIYAIWHFLVLAIR